tara:strand:- start:908 stop:1567 length:660 start_codon:yes stop_codon:yes gene_type:complete
MDIFQYWNTHYEIRPDKQIICKETKQLYKIDVKDIWLVFKTDEDYIALPYIIIREFDYPYVPLFSPNCLGWTNNKYDNPTEAINERICYYTLSKKYGKRAAEMLIRKFKNNNLKYSSRVPTLLMFCIANLHVNLKNNDMLITEWEYAPPPHILRQICYQNIYHGWYSQDRYRPNDVLYGTFNKKIWIWGVSKDRDEYKYDKDLVYVGIVLKFIKHKKSR